MIGDNIKNQRKRNGLTQAELAARARISQGQLSQYERNDVTPSLDILSRIADALRVSVAVLDRRLLVPPDKVRQSAGGIRGLIDGKLDGMSDEELARVYLYITTLEAEKKQGDTSPVAGVRGA